MNMSWRSIGFVMFPLVLLGCSSNGGARDDSGGESDAADVVIILPTFEVSPPLDGPRCTCGTPSSQTLNGPETVSCQSSPSYCGECPVPFHEPDSCTTIGLHCGYPETWCDCITVDGGTPVWKCDASP
jgi:hypothetical protein